MQEGPALSLFFSLSSPSTRPEKDEVFRPFQTILSRWASGSSTSSSWSSPRRIAATSINRSLGGPSPPSVSPPPPPLPFLLIPGLAVAAAALSKSSREMETSPAKEAENGAAAAAAAEA